MSATSSIDQAPLPATLGGGVPEPSGLSLSLLGTWRLTHGTTEIRVPANRQRLIALLALSGPQNRAFVAGVLWSDRPETHAQSNLRSTLSRLQSSGLSIVESVGYLLRLSPQVRVDVAQLVSCAESIVYRRCDLPPDSATVLQLQQGRDLLVGWYDDWVVAHRDRLRHLRLHALEIAAGSLSNAGRFAEALEAALATVEGEPLRESAHRAVILIHLAEGNRVEAVRQFQTYRSLLHRELGIEPSQQMLRLVEPYMRQRRANGRLTMRDYTQRRTA
jgi:DNA-binding SARP family transcriptional activator